MWESTPIINILQFAPEEKLEQFMVQCRKMHLTARPPVSFHKEKLGRQKYTWAGEYRYWIWEGIGWRIYCSNIRGIEFEVQSDLSWQLALDAWNDYQKKAGLL